MYTIEKGKRGEQLAAEYLSKAGYNVILTNYHTKFGEIDIISRNDKYIVFVEVKTYRKGSMLRPAESVNIYKQKKIIKTACKYILDNKIKIQPRFDVLEILVNNEDFSAVEINHIKNAFCQEEEYAAF